LNGEPVVTLATIPPRSLCRSRLVTVLSHLKPRETGQPYVGLEVIGKLAEALEVEPAELLKLPSRRSR